MFDIKKEIRKLATTNPELRVHLVPILKQAAHPIVEWKNFDHYVSQNPSGYKDGLGGYAHYDKLSPEAQEAARLDWEFKEKGNADYRKKMDEQKKLDEARDDHIGSPDRERDELINYYNSDPEKIAVVLKNRNADRGVQVEIANIMVETGEVPNYVYQKLRDIPLHPEFFKVIEKSEKLGLRILSVNHKDADMKHVVEVLRSAGGGGTYDKMLVDWALSNPSLPDRVLFDFATNMEVNSVEDFGHALVISQRSNVPTAVLDHFATVKNPRGREIAAGSPKTSPRTLVMLARDKNADVRRKVALNPNAPTEALSDLANDPNRLVAQHAQKALSRR